MIVTLLRHFSSQNAQAVYTGVPVVSLRKMDIKSVVVGGGPIASIIVLEPQDALHKSSLRLPIRIGHIEAMAISLGVDQTPQGRPLTHDLMRSLLDALNADLKSVRITGVSGTTFFAQLEIISDEGKHHYIDARPSDAVALAVRTGSPIYADEMVLETAAAPDFADVEKDVKKQEMADFHEFVESLNPEDFS